MEVLWLFEKKKGFKLAYCLNHWIDHLTLFAIRYIYQRQSGTFILKNYPLFCLTSAGLICIYPIIYWPSYRTPIQQHILQLHATKIDFKKWDKNLPGRPSGFPEFSKPPAPDWMLCELDVDGAMLVIDELPPPIKLWWWDEWCEWWWDKPAEWWWWWWWCKFSRA